MLVRFNYSTDRKFENTAVFTKQFLMCELTLAECGMTLNSKYPDTTHHVTNETSFVYIQPETCTALPVRKSIIFDV